MNDYDRAARCQVKEDPNGQVHWLLPHLPEAIRYAQWLDSQIAPRPGEPDRRCDTIAELIDHTPGQPWALVIQLFASPDSEALERTLEYVWRFYRDLRHGPHTRDRYAMGAVLVFLTDAPPTQLADFTMPGGDCNLSAQPRIVCLAEEDAVATLEAIDNNRISTAILGWVSLMKGGQSEQVVQRWRELAERIPDVQRQRTLASLAVVFAELTNSCSIWQKGLEGFAVKESPFIREMRDEGRNEGRREGRDEGRREGEIKAKQEMLTGFLCLRTKENESIPEELIQRIQNQTDPTVLTNWFNKAVTSESIGAFIDSLAEPR